MFDFIRGMFDKSASNFSSHPGYGAPPIYDVHVFPKFPSIDSPYLSQAELQMLQRIVADEIRFEHQQKEYFKDAAIACTTFTDERSYYFKEHRKSKANLKKLAQLQYRLKHRIVAKG